MLIGTGHEVIKGVIIRLVFDDQSVKKVEVYVNDIVDVVYAKDGCRRKITGRVTRIETTNDHAGHIGHVASCGNCKNEGVYLVVDGSEDTVSRVVKIDVDCILDIDLLEKHGETNAITSPLGCYNITNFRLVGNKLQLSQDYGSTWLNVVDLPDHEVVVDPDDQDLADKISALIPECANPSMKDKLVKDLVELFDQEKGNADDPGDSNG